MDHLEYAKISFMVLIPVICWLIWLIHIQLRCLKYKKIALALNADYHSKGFFNTGRITGISNSRQYAIENIIVDTGRSSTTWTTLSVDCLNSGVTLSIGGGFFGGLFSRFPDWYCISVHNENRKFDGDFNENYRVQILDLFQKLALSLEEIKLIKKGSIDIGQRVVTFTFLGVLADINKINKIITLIVKLAGHIEFAPLMYEKNAE